MSAVLVRPEGRGDAAAIYNVHQSAFSNVAMSDGSEPKVIDRLRADGDLALSLVAEDAGEIVGHIAFSPVTISDGSEGWYGLAPVSTVPSRRKEGIAAALIERGIADLRERGANGIVLLGDPKFYGRFGFQCEPALYLPGCPTGYFQHLVLNGSTPKGTVKYAPAFG